MAVAGALTVPPSLIRQLHPSSAGGYDRLCCASSSYCSTSILAGLSSSSFRRKAIRRIGTLKASRELAAALRRGVLSVRASQEASTSTLLVQDVDFIWKGQGSEVLLTGEFCNWETKLALEKRSDGVFSLKQKLALGTYSYKFIVDGEWKHSPDCPTVPDGTGGLNNEVVVTADQTSKQATKDSLASLNTQLPRTTNNLETTEVPKESDSLEKPVATTKPVNENDSVGKPVAAAKPAKKSDNPEKPVGTIAPAKEIDRVEKPDATANLAKETGNAQKPVAAAKPAKKSDGPEKAVGTMETAKESESVRKPEAAANVAKETDSAKEPVPAAKPAKTSDSPETSETTTKPPKKTGSPVAGGEVKQAPKAAPKAAPKKKAVVKSLEATMLEDVIPQLTTTLGKEAGLTDLDISFEENQLKTSFAKGDIPYCFWAFFPDGTLEGSRGSALTSHGSPPSTIEPFLIDEKKITPELIVFWIKKRLFVQQLLSVN